MDARPRTGSLVTGGALGGAVLLVFLAPAFRGGNRPLPLMGLEWLALGLLGLMALAWLMRPPGTFAPASSENWASFAPSRLAEWLLVLSPVWLALLYLTPLPAAVWRAIPGRDIYLAFGGSGARPISLMPDATLSSLLAMIPVLAVYAVARLVDASRLRWLVAAGVASACLQSVWGLLQIGPLKSLYFGAEFAGNAMGGFANANHFASFIGMTLPLSLWLMWGHKLTSSRAGLRGRGTIDQVSLAYGLIVFILLAGLAGSGSRAGCAVGVLVVVLAALLLASAAETGSRRPYLVGLAVLLLGVVAALGAAGIFTRFDASRLGEDAWLRWRVAASTWGGALALWPLGSGPGSFAGVFPRFQPAGLNHFAEHAHNDYVEFLMELGLAFVVLALALAGLMVHQLRRLWAQTWLDVEDFPPALLPLCAGLGLVAIGIHSFVDFNLRIPANATLAALLLGLFLRPLETDDAEGIAPSDGRESAALSPARVQQLA
ncbi:MAG: O-antigen ligase family protein [Pseudomonadota bacterium]